jgi:hypothetical protein
VGEDKKEIDGSVVKKAREEKKIKTQRKKQQQSKNRRYNSKERNYFGKGVTTTERLHAVGRRDFMVLTQ